MNKNKPNPLLQIAFFVVMLLGVPLCMVLVVVAWARLNYGF